MGVPTVLQEVRPGVWMSKLLRGRTVRPCMVDDLLAILVVVHIIDPPQSAGGPIIDPSPLALSVPP